VRRGAVHLDLWFDAERFALGCQSLGALAFLFGLLVFLLSPLVFPFY
jgi:hypothetical protein